VKAWLNYAALFVMPRKSDNLRRAVWYVVQELFDVKGMEEQ
jgi:hypothetical protein